MRFEVRLGDTISKSKTVAAGVPQGKPLSPLLFLLLYIIFQITIKNDIALFADEEALITSGRSLHGTMPGFSATSKKSPGAYHVEVKT